MSSGNKLLLNQVGQDLTVAKGIGLKLVIAYRSNDRNSPIQVTSSGLSRMALLPHL